MTDLFRQLNILPGITAVIGSGGKTSLLTRLFRELPGTVILCTSTHIYPPEDLPLFTGILTEMPVPKLCLGTPAAEGKLTAPQQEYETLKKLADYILVEADGSRGLPLKAHLPHEPVIPSDADQVIGVLGLSGLGKPIAQAAHRPERYAALCGAAVTDPVTPERAAAVLRQESLANCWVFNQADSSEEELQGRTLGTLLGKPYILTCLND